jgi:MFS family permease
MAAAPHKWRSLALLALAEVFALSLWFSATAVIPALRRSFEISGFTASLYSSAVGAGFVAGTLLSALLALADRLDPRRLIALAALVAAAANAAILVVGPVSAGTIALRFVTGMCMAGLYPVGMKIAATWARGDMGLLIGALTAAVTLGTASPQLFNALGGVDWRFTIALTSALTVASAALIGFVRLGPGYAALAAGPRARAFRPELAARAWTDKALRLANFGYFGHMWELYVMWAWIGLFLDASFAAWAGDGAAVERWAALGAFAVIAAGAAGCFGGGWIADRIGRTAFTSIMMTVSGLCTLTVGLLFGLDPVWIVLLGLVWGFTIVADSPQFSSSIIELSDPETTGTMLTMQTCIGFLLTLVAIHLMPPLVAALGWRYAFMPFAVGPAFGVWAMLRLRARPEAVRIAGGRR